MKEHRKPNPFDPTDERTADPSAGGATDEGVNRDYDDKTPRRYERPEHQDPARPNDDPTLRTEM